VAWIGEAGLALDIIGALILASGLLIGTKRALELGVTSRLAGTTDEENLQLPQVRDRLKQSRRAKVGVALLVLGFLGQAIGNWPR
jgi:hypothetical protein